MEEDIEFRCAMKMTSVFAKSRIKKQMLKNAKAVKAFVEGC